MATSQYTPVSGIYVILNTKTKKVYIGKSNDIYARWKSHKSKLSNCIHYNKHLQSSWNKYGAKAFKFFVLEYCSIEVLNERERHHIGIYQSRGIAYNISIGDDGTSGHIVSEETRTKLREINTGKKHSESTKQKLRDIFKGKSKPPRSEEHRQNISKSKTGHVVSEETRKKISQTKKGVVSPKKGKAMSEEQKKKLSDSVKAMYAKKQLEKEEKSQ